MTQRLGGRVAVVTGGSRGLGRAIALALAAEGAAVAVVGRTEQMWDDRLPGTLGETVAAIEAAGGRAVAIRADLTDRDDVARLVGEARDALRPRRTGRPSPRRAGHRCPVPSRAPSPPGPPGPPNRAGRGSSARPWPPFAATSTSRCSRPIS